MTKKAKIDEINSIFFKLVDKICQLFDGEFNIRLELDHRDRYPEERNFAMSSREVVYLSPKILKSDKSRIEALLMHELAHVYLMKMGLYNHTELQTDQLAEILFDKRIYYDEHDIQTTRPGKYPRPSYLPNK